MRGVRSPLRASGVERGGGERHPSTSSVELPGTCTVITLTIIHSGLYLTENSSDISCAKTTQDTCGAPHPRSPTSHRQHYAQCLTSQKLNGTTAHLSLLPRPYSRPPPPPPRAPTNELTSASAARSSLMTSLPLPTPPLPPTRTPSTLTSTSTSSLSRPSHPPPPPMTPPTQTSNSVSSQVRARL